MEQQAGRFREVIAWQKAYALALAIYRATSAFPSDERFGLIQQMRRAAVSVPSNIAEGWGRGSTADYQRFVGIARGSLYELLTQLLLATDLQYLSASNDIHALVAEVERIINGLYRSLMDKVAQNE